MKLPPLLHGYALDGRGGGTRLQDAETPADTGAALWLHLDANDTAAREWLAHGAGLNEVIADALLAEETRPRSLSTADGLLVVLRGVNTNPGADPEDMVSIRVWLEAGRIITVRRRRLLSVEDVRAAIEHGEGPGSTGGFLGALVERLADRIGGFVDDIEDRIGDAEERLLETEAGDSRRELASLRREMASVRRFLAPQRDALDRMHRQPGDWISASDGQQLREEADRITRYLEDLDLARERAIVLQEELLNILAQQQNQRIYLLSVVAAIFLPLTFVTGLLGMNVGGLPGVDSRWGFVGAIGVMAVVVGLVMLVFRRKRWI